MKKKKNPFLPQLFFFSPVGFLAFSFSFWAVLFAAFRRPFILDFFFFIFPISSAPRFF